SIKQMVRTHLLMPGGQHLGRLGMANARGVFRQVAFLWKCIQSRKQCQAFVGDQRHDMAVTFDGPEFECQTTPQCLFGRDHFGSWHMGALDRKSTRLNSSHSQISYAVFCLKKKKKE